MAENIETETVHINESINYWDFLAPFGGFKSSGRGSIQSSWIMEIFY
jgi:acyl-CoA reductase-like NAD-dependent aldehyde dehydrogenase